MLAIFCNVSHAKLLRWSDGAIVEGEAEEPTRTVTRTPDGLIVTYEFGEYGIGSPVTGDTGSTIEMPGFIPCSTDGEPAYLLKKERFNIPNAPACSVEILEEEYKDFNITLAPAQPLQLMTDPEPPQASPITAYAGHKPQNYYVFPN